MKPFPLFVSRNLSRKDRTMPDSNEIDARVTKVLVQALGVDEDDIKASATLQGDLGAESIDFLDIAFRLEREFGIKVRQGELFAGTVLQGATEIVQDGRVTDEGLAALRAQMPYADLRDLDRDRRLNRIDDLFTVDLLSRFISSRGSSVGAAGPVGMSPRRGTITPPTTPDPGPRQTGRFSPSWPHQPT
jgi:acyl carrier protein